MYLDCGRYLVPLISRHHEVLPCHQIFKLRDEIRIFEEVAHSSCSMFSLINVHYVAKEEHGEAEGDQGETLVEQDFFQEI